MGLTGGERDRAILLHEIRGHAEGVLVGVVGRLVDGIRYGYGWGRLGTMDGGWDRERRRGLVGRLRWEVACEYWVGSRLGLVERRGLGENGCEL